MKLPSYWRGDRARSVSITQSGALVQWAKKYRAVVQHIRHVFADVNLDLQFNPYRAPFLTLAVLTAESDQFAGDDWSGPMISIASNLTHQAVTALALAPEFKFNRLIMLHPDQGLSAEHERWIRDHSAKVIIEFAAILDYPNLCRKLESLPKQDILVVGECYPDWLKNCAYLEMPSGCERSGCISNPVVLTDFRSIGGDPEALIAGALEASERLVSLYDLDQGILPLSGYLIAARNRWTPELFISPDETLHPLVGWANAYWDSNVRAQIPQPADGYDSARPDEVIVLRSMHENVTQRPSPDTNLMTITVNERDQFGLGFVTFLIELMSVVILANVLEPPAKPAQPFCLHE